MGRERAPTRLGRLLALYAALVALPVVVTIAASVIGSQQHPPTGVSGTYRVAPAAGCLGSRLTLQQSGRFVDAVGSPSARLELDGTTLSGVLTCTNGRSADLRADVARGSGQAVALRGTVGGEPVLASGREASQTGSTPRAARSNEETFGRLMLAIAAVILAARLLGAAIRRLGEPQVMGEVLAGILLGPTFLGVVAPSLEEYVFPPDIVTLLGGAADIGLAFYMFLVGLELDPRQLRGRLVPASLISNASIAVPFAVGAVAAIPIYSLVGPDRPYLPFAMFVGAAMSITAFPVLARILIERRMLRGPVGVMALASAALNDVAAWGLLALASAVAGAGSTLTVARVLGLTALFSAAMALAGRPLLARVSAAFDESGTVPIGWVATIFVGILLSAYVSQQIGIAAIFGAFVMGMIMPRRADLNSDINGRLHDFVVTVLLPLFFVVTGLRTDIGLLNRPVLWLIALVIIAVAVAGKLVSAMVAARGVGHSVRDATVFGVLMNTRGLTELIVLNIGRDLGIVPPALFAILVLMALATTLMTGPLLRLVDPRRELSAPAEDAMRAARRRTGEHAGAALPERAILVASEDGRNLNALLSLAEPLALAEPPREVILVRLVVPARLATGLTGDDRQLRAAADEVAEHCDRLVARNVSARAVAFTSADPGDDLVRLASEHEVDLVLVDGRRPVLGEGVPRGPVGTLLDRAPCDVAVLVERDAAPPPVGSDRPVEVPFGGAEHDWAALELGAWIASNRRAPLRLLGAAGSVVEGRRDASHLLADASLVVQQLTGVVSEPMLVEPGREGVLEAARGAGLLVVGLSERWRREGLGPVRSAIARSAEAPTVFVRRGSRPGVLAHRERATRFAWSTVAPVAST